MISLGKMQFIVSDGPVIEIGQTGQFEQEHYQIQIFPLDPDKFAQLRAEVWYWDGNNYVMKHHAILAYIDNLSSYSGIRKRVKRWYDSGFSDEYIDKRLPVPE